MKIKILVEYHGAEFSGWQFQPGKRTVEAELKRSIEIFARSEGRKQGIEIDQDFPLTASGRTDSGVHAKGQTVNFNWPEGLRFDAGRLVDALNGITPTDIGVLSAQCVDQKFSARMSPHTKCYRYYLMQRGPRSPLVGDRVWHVHAPLDLPPMIETARIFRGTHDFATFQAPDCNSASSLRTIFDSQLVRIDNEMLVFSIQGKGFLKNMVRKIVGTLVEVGKRKYSIDDVRRMLEQPKQVPSGMTAPAQGLFMEWVRYYEDFGISETEAVIGDQLSAVSCQQPADSASETESDSEG